MSRRPGRRRGFCGLFLCLALIAALPPPAPRFPRGDPVLRGIRDRERDGRRPPLAGPHAATDS